MPKTINPIRKAKIKQSLLEQIKLKHPSARKALKAAGASKYVINHSTTDKCVKLCMEEIKQEIDANSITLEMIFNNMLEERELAKAKKDISTMHQVSISLSKLKGYWTDKHEVKDTTEQDRRDILSRYSHN